MAEFTQLSVCLASPLSLSYDLQTSAPSPLTHTFALQTRFPPHLQHLTARPDFGSKRLTGTVVQVQEQSSVPMRARVTLIAEDHLAPVRRVSSDPLTGRYEFIELRDTRYTVIAQDLDGHHLSVIADHLQPDS